MPEEATYLKMLRVVVFEPVQYWRPKSQGWFAVLPLYGPHPMRILLIRNGTCLKRSMYSYSTVILSHMGLTQGFILKSKTNISTKA